MICSIQRLPFIVALIAIVFSPLNSSGQSEEWKEVSRQSLLAKSIKADIQTLKADYYTIDYESLNEKLLSANDGDIVQLPMGDGRYQSFILELNTTMHPDLDARYPSIRTFNIIAEDQRNLWGKLDISPKGMRALILIPGGATLFLDPYSHEDLNHYILYRGEDFLTDEAFICGVNGDHEVENSLNNGSRSGSDFNDCELKTYQLAVASNGEYSQAQGGTVELALAAVVAIVNRVNAIYERDFAGTTTLIANNDELIYLDPDTDPYDNSSTSPMLNQNQNNVDNTIGFQNYDIGHVFGLGGGGVAQLNSACGGGKARCVSRLNSTSTSAPNNIGLVAHEMGHQMGGSHSYNNECQGNRSNFNAVEPGSGSTILSYAGICAPNVQTFQSPYYHGWSMAQMGPSMDSDGCASRSALDNFAPEIESLPNQIVIPSGTPFVLSAQASDADGDTLTYSWEQIDNEITSDITPSPSWTEGPVFRSFPPSLSPERYFPSLPSAQSTTWEVLPSVARVMNFRVSVRDNSPGGGCTQYDDMAVITAGNSGPFVLEYPSDFGIVWQAFTDETIVWDVANTTASPVNAETVDIFLSTNGGNTYTIQLADDVPNTGTFDLEVPPIPTTVARIMVMNSEGYFFDVSNNSFEIQSISEGFDLFSFGDDGFVCAGDENSYVLGVGGALGFAESVELEVIETPSGVDVVIQDNQLSPGQETTVQVLNTQNVGIGSFEIVIQGSSQGFTDSDTLILNVNELNPIASSLIAPSSEEVIPSVYDFSWEASASPVVDYNLEIAFDENFEELFNTYVSISDNSFQVVGLPPEDTLYWRVSTDNFCGQVVSDSRVFSTEACGLSFPAELPVTIGAIAGTIESELLITQIGFVTGVRLTNLRGEHARLRDLRATLVSPLGTEVLLFDSICGNDDNFDFSFSDEGLQGFDCPATTGLFYAPEGDLSTFIGEESAGIWKLRIEDNFNGSGGILENWELEICYLESGLSVSEIDLFDATIYPNPSDGLFRISFGNSEEVETLRVFDIRGKLLESLQVNGNEFREIDLRDYSSGTYILNASGPRGSNSYKLVKTP